MSTKAGDVSGTTSVPLPASIPEPVGDRNVPARAPGLAATSRLVARWSESVWAPVVLRTVGIFGGMLALAAIGVASTLTGHGVPAAVAAPSAIAAPLTATPRGSDAPQSRTRVDVAGATTNAVEPPASGVTTDGKIILNTATVEDLQKLPRVGAKRAAAIIELRTKLGRFRQPTDLLRVRGIGRKTLQLLLPRVVVDPPRARNSPEAAP